LDQFQVESNPRYRRNRADRGETYCNIYVWDVTRAMGAEVPHWVDDAGNPKEPGRGHETTANGVVEWPDADGARFGWQEVGSDRAQDLANLGQPVIAAWLNPKGIGHVAMVRPCSPSREGPLLSQAGQTNSRSILASDAFGEAWTRREVRYFAHTEPASLPDLAAPDVPRWMVEQWDLNQNARRHTVLWRISRWGRRCYQALLAALILAFGVGVIRSWLPLGTQAQAWLWRFGTVPLLLAVLPVAALRWLNPSTTASMLVSRRGRSPSGGRRGRARRDWARLNDISSNMVLATLVSEDFYFFWHAGFNPLEVWRAYRYNRDERLPGSERRGGSTISQQVAKNLFLPPSQTYLRKAVEACITLLIEGLWPKSRILEVYLNIIPFGEDVYGVDAAARHYFGRGARDLTTQQAALMAVAIRGPAVYRIDAPSPKMRRIQAEICSRMAWGGDGFLADLPEAVGRRGRAGAGTFNRTGESTPDAGLLSRS
jgi:monofunctional glycosyltransferase